MKKKPIFGTLKRIVKMKNLYTSKKFQRMAFLFGVVLSAGIVVSSCKNDDEEDLYKDHVVQFEVKASKGVYIKSINTQIGTTQNLPIYDPFPIPVPPPTTPPQEVVWQSDQMIVNSSQSSVNLSSNAVPLDATSTLITNIYVDGVLKKTDTSKTGNPRVSQLHYSFVGLQ